MVSYLKRVYSVAEFRTGFVAGSCALLGVSYGAYNSAEDKLWLAVLIVLSAFCFNVVANIAAEISGYLKFEDAEHQTGHSGSEGLVRGDASLFDAVSSLVLFSGLAIGFGFIVVIITKRLLLIGLGAIGFLIAILYSLTPVSINKYPISEIVSGLMCGAFCFIAGVAIYLPIDANILLFAIIPLLMVSFLMAANNTTDYYKDLGVRTTFPHLIGFENSIKIIAPQLLLIFGLWIYLSLVALNSLFIMIIGLLVLIYFGLIKWYLPYLKVTPETIDLSRIYGPLPLALLLPFNAIISITLIILR